MTAVDAPLLVETDSGVAQLTMNRPDKRNAMNDALLEEIDRFFRAPPEGVRGARGGATR